MKASELVDKLIEADADSVDPKSYLRRVESPMREVAIKNLVTALVDEENVDSRDLVARGLVTIGVDPHLAKLIALEQGSSQAYVNWHYLKSSGLGGRVLKDAVEFIKVVYDVEQDEDLLYHLHNQYTKL
jgi:hypothetical protein